MGIAGILAAGCGAAGAVVGMAEVYCLISFDVTWQ